jgi:hypothetical protein
MSVNRDLAIVKMDLIPSHQRDRVRCSFCGRNWNRVAAMVSGPGVYVCDRCVRDAAQIIAESGVPSPDRPVS